MISIFRHRFLKASLLTTKPNPCLPLPPHHDEPATLRKRCSTPKKKTHLLVSVWPSTIVVQNAQLLYTTTVFQQQTHTGTDFSQHHINNKYNMVVVRSCSSVYMSLRCRNCIWTHRTCWQWIHHPSVSILDWSTPSHAPWPPTTISLRWWMVRRLLSSPKINTVIKHAHQHAAAQNKNSTYLFYYSLYMCVVRVFWLLWGGGRGRGGGGGGGVTVTSGNSYTTEWVPHEKQHASWILPSWSTACILKIMSMHGVKRTWTPIKYQSSSTQKCVKKLSRY